MSVSSQWIADQKKYGWEMPVAAWWKRLFFVRHLRALILGVSVARHNAFWCAAGLIPTAYDAWVLHGIWNGQEQRP